MFLRKGKSFLVSCGHVLGSNTYFSGQIFAQNSVWKIRDFVQKQALGFKVRTAHPHPDQRERERGGGGVPADFVMMFLQPRGQP